MRSELGAFPITECKGVLPSLLGELMSAPAATKARISPGLYIAEEAVCSGVSPSELRAFAFAPVSNKSFVRRPTRSEILLLKLK